MAQAARRNIGGVDCAGTQYLCEAENAGYRSRIREDVEARVAKAEEAAAHVLARDADDACKKDMKDLVWRLCVATGAVDCPWGENKKDPRVARKCIAQLLKKYKNHIRQKYEPMIKRKRSESPEKLYNSQIELQTDSDEEKKLGK